MSGGLPPRSVVFRTEIGSGRPPTSARAPAQHTPALPTEGRVP